MATYMELWAFSRPPTWSSGNPICAVCSKKAVDHFMDGWCPMGNGDPPCMKSIIGMQKQIIDPSKVRGRFGIPLTKEMQIIGIDMVVNSKVAQSGANCKKCNEFNSYAEATDNYVCYSCRH